MTLVLLTDFGYQDPFVGVLKGVLLSRAPKARILDLTHGIAPGDVSTAAFWLMSCFFYFPKGSLFVVVVDSGVGSERKILWARTKNYRFLAPDNGALSWVEKKEAFLEVREVSNPKFFLSPVSSTFHGRDIFAPAAAALLKGAAARSLGPRVSDFSKVDFPSPVVLPSGRVSGKILAVDHFGNAVTSFAAQELRPDDQFLLHGKNLGPLKKSYSQAEIGKPVAVLGSSGFVELSLRQSSLAREWGVRSGDTVEIKRK